MAKKRVTSIQVAKLAGVSQSAVSRVFTPGASVGKAARIRVHEAAKELGYRPNVLARSLITGRSRMIGLVVAYLDNYFYAEAVEKLSTELQQKGYHVLVFMVSKTLQGIDKVVHEILDYQVDGIIFASVSMSSDLTARCAEAGIPAVLVNRAQDDSRLSSVTADNISGGKKVASFLVAGGHKRISYIAGWEGASTQRDREKGFVDELRSHGLELYARGVGNFNSDEARRAARNMFGNNEKPDAVFVASDAMAFTVMDVLRYELNLNVPEDVSVVGYDDVAISSWPAYDLTSVRSPINRMVDETISILMDFIEGKTNEHRCIEIDGPLVLRKSARISDRGSKR